MSKTVFSHFHCFFAMNAINSLNRFWVSIILLYIFIEDISSAKISHFVAKKCNYIDYLNGCADSMGSQCDKQTNTCVCKSDFTIKLDDYCLQPKYIGDSCFTSFQCNHIPFAGCFNFREEFYQNPFKFFGPKQNQWPSGVCRCKIGYYFNPDTSTCVKRIIGSWCSNSWDCHKVNEDKRLINPFDCEDNACKCSADYEYNRSEDDCNYKETYGMVCETRDQCTNPTVCINKTCDCNSNYHLDTTKSPNCQLNHNLNDVTKEGSLDVPKGDKTFEIFILTVIPLIIIFLTLKPCLKKFGKCKPQTDEVICGSKEISIKCTDFDKDMALNHKFCEKLQTIEEVGEDIKLKDEEEVIASDQVVVENDNKEEEEVEDKTTEDEKSIDNSVSKDNGVDETTISMECSANS